jgi:carbon monoxide dehydrogenase subunit G
MKLEQSFEVSAPLQRVWEALIDVERVAPCLPGATVTGRNDDGSYNGEFKVKIGPTSAAYSGKLNMESVDEDSHHATMQAAGTDKRGQGGAKATIESSVEEIDAGTTQVNVSTDYHITGRLARFGRGGMIEEISNRLLREFAERLQAMLTSGGGDDGGSADGTSAAATEAAAADTEAAAADTNAAAADTEAAAGGTDEPPAASSDEPPAAAAGSQGEPDAPGHAQEATAEANAAVPAQNAAADADPFAPAAPSPPPSGTAAGNAPPPPSSPPQPPPPADNEPMQGLSLVGGAVFSQIKRKPAPFVGALVAILVAFRLLRRRGRG